MEYKNMLVAITAVENSLQAEIDPRFGRAAYFMIVDTETEELTAHNNSDGVGASNGAGTGAAQTLSEYRVEALYTGSVGPKAAGVLDQANIPYYENITGTVQGVLDQLKNCGSSPSSVSANQNDSAQIGNQPATNEAPSAAPQCPGVKPGNGQGLGIGAGRAQGLGRGMGAGRGAGNGQGRGGCRR